MNEFIDTLKQVAERGSLDRSRARSGAHLAAEQVDDPLKLTPPRGHEVLGLMAREWLRPGCRPPSLGPPRPRSKSTSAQHPREGSA